MRLGFEWRFRSFEITIMVASFVRHSVLCMLIDLLHLSFLYSSILEAFSQENVLAKYAIDRFCSCVSPLLCPPVLPLPVPRAARYQFN